MVSEIQRKSFHLLGLIFPISYDIFPSHIHLLPPILILTAITAFLLDTLRIHFKIDFNSPFLRDSEKTKRTKVPQFLMGLSFAIFNNSKSALYALFVGDSMAALVGISCGKHKVYGKKSLEGCVAFVGFVALFCSVEQGVRSGIVAGVSGCIFELFSGEYDNFAIPVGVTIVMKLAGFE